MKVICILSHKMFAACRWGRFNLQLVASSVLSSILRQMLCSAGKKERIYYILKCHKRTLLESMSAGWVTNSVYRMTNLKDGNGKHFEVVKLVLKQTTNSVNNLKFITLFVKINKTF